MRAHPVVSLLVVVTSAVAARAEPAPSWQDVPALVAAAAGAVDQELRGCLQGKATRTLGLVATRDRAGHTHVEMPLPEYVGKQGLRPEDACLMPVAAKIRLPALPAEVDQVLFGYTVGSAGPTADPAFAAWRDLGGALAKVIDPARRDALATCSTKPRTVRIVLDLRAGKTRAWLPAWQFHSASGDGTTPAVEARIKACLTRTLATWKPPVLPAQLPELELAIRPRG